MVEKYTKSKVNNLVGKIDLCDNKDDALKIGTRLSNEQIPFENFTLKKINNKIYLTIKPYIRLKEI